MRTEEQSWSLTHLMTQALIGEPLVEVILAVYCKQHESIRARQVSRCQQARIGSWKHVRCRPG